MRLERVIARSLLTTAALLATPCALADDAPVEKPAVDKPALPQQSADHPSPASPAHTSSQSTTPQRSTQASNDRSSSGTPAGAGDKQRPFVYLGAGLGVLSGLSGGQDFERTNPALTGTVGIEIPLARATGLGFELNGDLELAASADRGTYTGVLVRARLAQMLTRRNRVWGAVGIGGAGYQSGSLAFAFAAGTSLILVPKFGLDLSANLNLLTASSETNANNPALRNEYPGGAVFLLAFRALFEFHR